MELLGLSREGCCQKANVSKNFSERWTAKNRDTKIVLSIVDVLVPASLMESRAQLFYERRNSRSNMTSSVRDYKKLRVSRSLPRWLMWNWNRKTALRVPGT